MTYQEKQVYYSAIHSRYQRASRAEKGPILDEYCSVCGYQRKYAIRKLNQVTSSQPRKKPGRPSRYEQPELIKALREIWFATDQMCGKRLVAALPEWLPHYEKTHPSDRVDRVPGNLE